MKLYIVTDQSAYKSIIDDAQLCDVHAVFDHAVEAAEDGQHVYCIEFTSSWKVSKVVTTKADQLSGTPE